jgi:hypothetical protein
MNTYYYKTCRFIHKDEPGKYVIHQVLKSIELQECETLAKEMIGIKEQLHFVNDENKLIQRKLQEREQGKRTTEQYLILTSVKNAS